MEPCFAVCRARCEFEPEEVAWVLAGTTDLGDVSFVCGCVCDPFLSEQWEVCIPKEACEEARALEPNEPNLRCDKDG